MKTPRIPFVRLTSFLGLTVLLSCTHTDKNRLPYPKIEPGIAKISGRMTGVQREKTGPVPVIRLYASNLITEESAQFETRPNQEGTFAFEVPVEFNSIGILIFTLSEKRVSYVVPLEAGQESELELDDKGHILRIEYTGAMKMTPYDIEQYFHALTKFYEYSPDPENLYELTPEEFVRHEMEVLDKRSKFALDSTSFSEPVRNLLQNEFKLMILKGRLLSYMESVEMNYHTLTSGEEREPFTAQKPGRSYYSFLRRFDLNDPLYLYNDAYPKVLQAILATDSLYIPPVKYGSIARWITKAKASLTDLIGFDSGIFYDMLAANAYVRQFNTETKSLSDIQKENIAVYFGNKGIAKTILAKNRQVMEREARKNGLVVNDTPDVPREELMQAILSKYEGKVVVVDFWATWCGPCLDAIVENREVKEIMAGRDVVFVYMAEESSPRDKWNNRVGSIGGEHYYLDKEEWEYLSDELGIERIPTYRFYDRQGVIREAKNGYPGKERMQKIIEDILRE